MIARRPHRTRQDARNACGSYEMTSHAFRAALLPWLFTRRVSAGSLLTIANPECLSSIGAGGESRTPDLRITNALLYQLSYTGVSCGRAPSETNGAGKAHNYSAESRGARQPRGLEIPNSASRPFHMICTPMHSRMNAERRITTASPVAARACAGSRSANAKQK